MAEEENTGEKRNDETAVGPYHPPVSTRFQPGNPGGPGRPKGSNYKARFKELLEKYSTYTAPAKLVEAIKKELPDLPEGITIEEAEAFRVHMAAMMGESWAYDRLHDKPGQSTDITTKGKEIKTAPQIVVRDQETADLLQKAFDKENGNGSDTDKSI